MPRHEIRTAIIERAAATGRRYPVTLSTETPVQRGAIFEVLRHDVKSIDLSRAPLPLIESHDRTRVNIGKVDNLRVVDRKLRGELVLGNSARALELAADIDADIVSGISIGYAIESEEQDGGTITATRWMPFEVSIVSVPADHVAGINRDLPMPETTTTPAAPDFTAERTRIADIRDIATRAAMPDTDLDLAIRDGTSVDAFRSRAFALMADREVQHRPLQNDGASARGDDFREAAGDALLLRAGITLAKPHAGARDLISTSLPDMARMCLSRGSQRHGELSGLKLFERAMSTSDFPLILANVADKALRQGYTEDLGTHTKWTRATTANDFKTINRVILSTAPDVEKVVEGGEYKFGNFTEDGDGFVVEKFGKIIRITWEALINDNLGAFTDIPRAIGQAARRKETDIVFDVLLANAGAGQTMNDTKSLFHADHNNLATGATLLDALDSARLKMRRQTGLGNARLNLAPRFLIVPPELEPAAERLLAAATRVTTGTGTTMETSIGWTAGLELIPEARLTNANVAYLSTSPTLVDTIEVAHLAGQEAPQIFEEDSFNVDARNWKVRHVIGARAIDWRGLQKLTIS